MTEAKQDKKPEYHFISTALHSGKVVARVMDATQMEPGRTIDSLRSAAKVNQFNFHALKGLHLMDADVLKIKIEEAKNSGNKHNLAQLTRAGEMVAFRQRGLDAAPGAPKAPAQTTSAPRPQQASL